MREFTGNDLKGRHVIDSHGRDLGTVEDVAIDPDMWRIRGVVVGVNKEVADDLRLESKGFQHAKLELSPDRIQAVGEHVLLNLDADELAGILRRTSDY